MSSEAALATSAAGGGRGVEADPAAVNSRYAWYVLAVLVLVYTLSSMDRAILSILAEDLKRRFHLSDSQLGFLHGTAFGVFYALFGYPVGRLVDRWNRVKLLSIGLALWSAMTALCGLSATVGQLIVSRIAVGIGEASASPAGFSLLADWFSKTKRGTALGVYIGGLYLGSGLALAIGGFVVVHWELVYPGGGLFGLHGWQVAFLAVGLPGIPLAFWIASLREPRRGLADGLFRPTEDRIWTRFLNDIFAVLPPFTLIEAARCGGRPFAVNIVAALVAAGLSWGAIALTGDALQWLALGVGYYAAFSSAQSLRHRDPPTFALTWGTPAFLFTMIGFGTVSMLNVNMGFWTAPLALRSLPTDKATIGLILGVTAAVGGVLGVLAGGRVSDMLLRRTPAGRIWVGLGAAILPVPFVLGMCLTHTPWLFFLCNVPVAFFGNIWIAAGAATVQELVLPRMRGTSTITYFLVSILLGSGLGPYVIGKISGIEGSLSVGVAAGLCSAPIAVGALLLAMRRVPRAEADKESRAAAAGEGAA